MSEISQWELHKIYTSVRAAHQAQLMAGAGRCGGGMGADIYHLWPGSRRPRDGKWEVVLFMPPN